MTNSEAMMVIEELKRRSDPSDKGEEFEKVFTPWEKMHALQLALSTMQDYERLKAIVAQDYTAGRMTELEAELAKVKAECEELRNIIDGYDNKLRIENTTLKQDRNRLQSIVSSQKEALEKILSLPRSESNWAIIIDIARASLGQLEER